MFSVKVPATSANLGPGFDCLGLALGLYNRLLVMPAPELCLEVQGEGADELSSGQDNLVWRSACRLFRELGVLPVPVRLQMQNAIPLGRGLGSSSAAIVGGLLLANHLTGDKLDRQRLLLLASELEGHPDNVAPAIFGGLTVSISEAGAVRTLGFPFPENLQLVVCIPEFQLSTERARRALPMAVSQPDAVYNLSRVAFLLAALQAQRTDLLGLAAADRLHQPYRLGLIPGGEAALLAARQAGAAAATISGSGPTMLAMVPEGVSAVAVGTAMVSAFALAGVNAKQLVLALDRQGARISP